MANPSGGSNSGSDGGPNGTRWFNDRRFNFATSAGRLRHNFNQFLTEVNQAARQNPELVGQLRTQLQTISDLINLHQQEQQPGGGGESSGLPTTHPAPPLSASSRQNSAEEEGSPHPLRRTSASRINVQQQHNSESPFYPSHSSAFIEASLNSAPREGHVVLDLEGNQEWNSVLDDSIPESGNEEEDRGMIQPPDPLPANQQPPAGHTDHNTEQDDWQRVLELLQSPEMQRIMKMILNVVPFLVIVFVKMFIDHFAGLLTLTLFLLLFYYANRTLVRFVSARVDGKCFDALKVLVVLSAGLSNLYLFFYDEKLWRTLLFLPASQLEFADHVDLCVVVWIVLSTDFVVKFGGMILKALVGLVPRTVFGYKRKRNVYQWIECSSQLYRHCLPILPWWYYILSTHSRHGIVMGLCFTLILIYIGFKASQVRQKLSDWKNSTLNLFRLHAYGTKPNSNEMYTAGPSCSICYGDYRDPLILTCKHVFCEECISTWFDREKTCPMCRAEVSQENVTWKCGSTTWLIQLF